MSDSAAPDNFEDITAAGRSRRSIRPRTSPTAVELTLRSLTELAADELEGWELSSMRDPRNWVAPGRRDRDRHRGAAPSADPARQAPPSTTPPSATVTRKGAPSRSRRGSSGADPVIPLLDRRKDRAWDVRFPRSPTRT